MFELYVGLCVLVGFWSASKRKNIYGGFFSGLSISLFLTPLIGIIFVMYQERPFKI